MLSPSRPDSLLCTSFHTGQLSAFAGYAATDDWQALTKADTSLLGTAGMHSG